MEDVEETMAVKLTYLSSLAVAFNDIALFHMKEESDEESVKTYKEAHIRVLNGDRLKNNIIH